MTTIGGYELLDALGRGGMAAVYRARDRRLDRLVAVKLVDGLDPELLQRFGQEARAMARLRHPHVAAVHDVGFADGRAYLVMDVFEGGSLAQRLRHGPLPSHDVARLGAKLARGLAHAHAREVLHRDLKPGNVLLDAEGEPALSDFGLARVLDRGGRLTISGEVLGTPAYMAPEQAQADPKVGPAADVYGLGATLYRAVTGRAPFDHPDLQALLTAVIEQPPAPPSAVQPGVDPRLERVLLRCLAKDPRQRYLSAARLAEALEALVEPQAAARARTRPARAPLLGMALLTLAACGVAVAEHVRARAAADREAEATRAQAATAAELARALEDQQRALQALQPLKAHVAGVGARVQELEAASPSGLSTRLIRTALLQGPPPLQALALQAALELASQEPGAEHQLLAVEALARAGDPEQALAAAEVLVVADADLPARVRLLIARAYAHMARGERIPAGQRAQQAVGTDRAAETSCLPAWEWLALAGALAQNRLHEAELAVLTHLIERHADPDAQVQRAALFWMQGQLDQALADLDACLRRAPEYAPARLMRAELRAGPLGDPEGARQDLADARARLHEQPRPLQARLRAELERIEQLVR